MWASWWYLVIFTFATISTSQEEPANNGYNYKHIKMIPIPEDESLLQPQFPEQVEERLAFTGIGKNGRRGRSHLRLKKSHVISKESEEDPEIELHKHRIYKSHYADNLLRGKSILENEVDTEARMKKRSSVDEQSVGETLKSAAASIQQDIAQEPPSLQKVKTSAASIQQDIVHLGNKIANKSMSQRQQQKETEALLRATRALSKRVQKQLATRQRRQDDTLNNITPYEACITIEIPGTYSDEEIEPLIPEKLQIKCPEPQPISSQLKSNTDYELQQQQWEENEDHDSDIDGVYWLKMPPNDPLDKKVILANLYNTIDELHHSGKDVLFVPISKGYSDSEEVKHGFLKSLHINPEAERAKKKYQKLQVTQVL